MGRRILKIFWVTDFFFKQGAVSMVDRAKPFLRYVEIWIFSFVRQSPGEQTQEASLAASL